MPSFVIGCLIGLALGLALGLYKAGAIKSDITALLVEIRALKALVSAATRTVAGDVKKVL